MKTRLELQRRFEAVRLRLDICTFNAKYAMLHPSRLTRKDVAQRNADLVVHCDAELRKLLGDLADAAGLEVKECPPSTLEWIQKQASAPLREALLMRLRDFSARHDSIGPARTSRSG